MEEIDRKIKEAELQRLLSETEKNIAERNHFNRKVWIFSISFLVAIASGIAFVATYSSFFADLYTIMTIDLREKREENDKLKTQINDARLEIKTIQNDKIALQHQYELLRQSFAKAPEVHPTFPTVNDIINSTIIIWWNTDYHDAFCLSFLAPGRYGDSYFAEGAQLGTSLSDLTYTTASKEWIGKWQVKGNSIVINETYPRRGNGFTITIDLNRRNENNYLYVERTIKDKTELGIAQLLFQPQSESNDTLKHGSNIGEN